MPVLVLNAFGRCRLHAEGVRVSYLFDKYTDSRIYSTNTESRTIHFDTLQSTDWKHAETFPSCRNTLPPSAQEWSVRTRFRTSVLPQVVGDSCRVVKHLNRIETSFLAEAPVPRNIQYYLMALNVHRLTSFRPGISEPNEFPISA